MNDGWQFCTLNGCLYRATFDNNMFKCPSNGKCISQSSHCDGSRDCDDGYDEVYDCNLCQTQGMFTCPTSGLCVQYCDGSIDCEDGSDEDKFECAIIAQAQCENKNFFFCPLSMKCISMLWHCDGQDDCIDGFDEMNCSAASVSSDTMGNRAMVEDYMESHSNPMKVNSQTFVKVYDLE